VVLMPAGTPPHKTLSGDPGAARRLEMCRLLVAGAAGVAVCALARERDGPSYTVDTLTAITASHPEVELTLIVGADIALTLPGWREPTRLLSLAHLAIAARPGTDGSAVGELLAALGGSTGGSTGVRFLAAPLLDVSSSMVRDRVAAGAPAQDLVGDRVARYIGEQRLYGAAAARPTVGPGAGPSAAGATGEWSGR
jgi:nicotinate-nucleotide adenylyltransferase